MLPLIAFAVWLQVIQVETICQIYVFGTDYIGKSFPIANALTMLYGRAMCYLPERKKPA